MSNRRKKIYTGALLSGFMGGRLDPRAVFLDAPLQSNIFFLLRHLTTSSERDERFLSVYLQLQLFRFADSIENT